MSESPAGYKVSRTAARAWRAAWREPGFPGRLAVTLLAIAATLFVFPRFLLAMEERPGVELADPLLAAIPAVELTWVIFGLIYGALLLAILFLGRHPHQLLLALQSYTVLLIVRMAAMYVVPLEPPREMILLDDPFVELIGTGKTLTKDLFFSGHTATLFTLFLTARHRIVRQVFLACSLLVGIFVVVQHVHYTVDVLAAPFFAYGCFRIARVIGGHAERRHERLE